MKTFKRLISMVVTVAMVFSLVLPNVSAQLPADSETITIFHTNDMHGAIATTDENAEKKVKGAIGLDLVAGIHADTPNSLLLDAGDFSQGNFNVSHDNGATAVKLMKIAGYDAAALGNHEFDYTLQDMYNNIALAADSSDGQNAFNVLAANVKGLDPALQPYTIKVMDSGLKVGIFGLLSPETAVTANPTKLQGITFEDVAATANATAEKLRTDEHCDVVICLSHCGYDDVSSKTIFSNNIAKAATKPSQKIDVIIDGHAHQVMLGDGSKRAGTYNTLIASTGTKLEYVGKVELTIDNSGNVNTTSTALSYADIKGHSDAATKAAIDKVTEQLAPVLNEVVGKAKSNLWGGNVGPNSISIARRTETNMGSLVADARRWQALAHFKDDAQNNTKPIVVLQGGGGVRSSIPAGDITMSQVLTVLPFGGSDAYVGVTPKLFYEVVEAGLSAMTGQDANTGALSADGSVHGRFPQASGFRYTYDVNGTASDVGNKVMGTRLKDIYLVNNDGTEKLLDRNDDSTEMILVCSDYEIGGGDGYYMLGDTNKIGEDNGSDVALVNYIKYLMTQPGNTDGISYPLDSGRIKIVNSNYHGTSFNATVKVSQDGVVLSGREFEVYSDGVLVDTVTADENSVLTVALKNGPQEVSVKSVDSGVGSGVVYMDNIAGLLYQEISADFLSTNVLNIEETINNLPTEINSDEDIENVFTILEAINNLSSAEYKSLNSDVVDKLNNAIEKIAIYNHSSGNVVVSGDLPWYVKVTATSMDGSEDAAAGLVKGIPSGKTLADIYEIKLYDMLNRADYTVEGSVDITLVSDGIQNKLKNIQVAHLKVDGTVEFLDAVVEGDQVSTSTSSFSVFGIVGEKVETSGNVNKPNDSANTGDDFAMATVVTFTALAGVAFVALRKKKEN